MHKFEMPAEYVARVTAFQGRPHTCETFDGPTIALVVVDMQNYFIHESQQMAFETAKEIVPNVNRLADAVRKAGGLVVWIQNFAPDQSAKSWSTLRERYTPDRREWTSASERPL